MKQSQLAGVAALAACLLLVEFIAHQLVTSAHEPGLGLAVALALPVASALGALLGASTLRGRSAAFLQARAAHLTLLGGGMLVATVVGVTWASRRMAKASGATEWEDVAALALGWLLASGLLGAALALVLRATHQRLGRMVFALALGMALAALALPRLLPLETPHLALLTPGLAALAALALGYAGHEAKPHWAALWTLPLVVTALYAGDRGAPWLKVRTDSGRHSQIEHREWTTEGLIAMNRVRNGKGSFVVGSSPNIPIGEASKPKQKPALEKQDLIYHLHTEKRGPVLVLGSLGGREVATARAYGHDTVSAIEPQGQLLNQLLLNRYAALTRPVLGDAEHVALSVGDGRAALPPHWGRYQYVIAMGDNYLRRSPPRLLPSSDRAYTQEALAGYLACLDPKQAGAVIVKVNDPNQLGRVVASAREALGAHADSPLDHLAVCGGDEDAVVMMSLPPFSPRDLRALRQKCHKGRVTLLYPPKEVSARPATRRGRRQPAPASRTPDDAAVTQLLRSSALRDALPFFEPPPAPNELGATASAALRTLRPFDPVAEAKAVKAEAARALKAAAASKASGDAPVAAADAPALRPQLSATQRSVGIATAVAVLAALLVVLAMLLLPRAAARRVGGPIRLALPMFGMASALVVYVLTELTLNALGDPAFAWSLLLPLGMLGFGVGALTADLTEARRRGLLRAGVIGVLVLGASAVAAAPLGLMGRFSVQGATAGGGLWLLLVGAAAGAPVVLSAKLMAAESDRAVAWTWGAYGAGWALGSAAVAVAVRYMSAPRLLIVGALLYAAAALLLAVALRPRGRQGIYLI